MIIVKDINFVLFKAGTECAVNIMITYSPLGPQQET
jgi:hypothetical protein